MRFARAGPSWPNSKRNGDHVNNRGVGGYAELAGMVLVLLGVAGCASHADFVEVSTQMSNVVASQDQTQKQQEALQRKKAEDEHHTKRKAYLRTLAADFDRCWQAADERAERGIASAYDEVQHALVDLADAYTLCASRADFDLKLAGFMARHGKRRALARRLSDAKLWKKS